VDHHGGRLRLRQRPRLGRRVCEQGLVAARIGGGRGRRVRGSRLRLGGWLEAVGTCGAPAGQASEQAAHGSAGNLVGSNPARSSIGSTSGRMTRTTREGALWCGGLPFSAGRPSGTPRPPPAPGPPPAAGGEKSPPA